MRSVTIKTTIPDDHRLVVDLPPDLPAGPAEVVVTPVPAEEARQAWTLGELLTSDLVGMWKDRTDIRVSLDFARQLRQEAEGRWRARD
jgi:hypothetical protein